MTSHPVDVPVPSGPVDLPPPQSFQLRFTKDRQGTAMVSVEARDMAEHVLATGTATGDVEPSKETNLSVTLTAIPMLTSFDVVAGVTTVSEHQMFTVHIVARDGAGGTLTNYKGTPTLTTDWGDTEGTTPPTFSQGEADVMLSLNRETVAPTVAHVTGRQREHRRQRTQMAARRDGHRLASHERLERNGLESIVASRNWGVRTLVSSSRCECSAVHNRTRIFPRWIAVPE
jgi:hypothetical protein